MKDLTEVKPAYPSLNLEPQNAGQDIINAPQFVTLPPAAPVWATGTGGSGTYLTSGNTTELTAMYNTLNDIYNALLKEGLIKQK